MEDESQINRHITTVSHGIYVVGMLLLISIPLSFHAYINGSPTLTPLPVVDSETENEVSVAAPAEVAVTVDDPRPQAAYNVEEKRTLHSSPVYGMKGEHDLYPIIERVAESYEVDPALIKAIVMAESNFNAMAVSKRGARGLMQLMPSTAEALGVEDIFNPEHNISGGVRYFKRLLDRFDGDITLALAAYNAGSAKVRKYNGVPPFKATQIYITKVIEYYRHYKGKRTQTMESA